jgi:predicted transcriptional regulator
MADQKLLLISAVDDLEVLKGLASELRVRILGLLCDGGKT